MSWTLIQLREAIHDVKLENVTGLCFGSGLLLVDCVASPVNVLA